MKTGNLMRNVAVPAASTSLILLGACEETGDEEKKISADLLIGEWELVSVDGETVGEEYEDYSYQLLFEFQSDGDFSFCYNYEYFNDPSENYEDCYAGSWEWITEGSSLTFNFEMTDLDEIFLCPLLFI